MSKTLETSTTVIYSAENCVKLNSQYNDVVNDSKKANVGLTDLRRNNLLQAVATRDQKDSQILKSHQSFFGTASHLQQQLLEHGGQNMQSVLADEMQNQFGFATSPNSVEYLLYYKQTRELPNGSTEDDVNCAAIRMAYMLTSFDDDGTMHFQVLDAKTNSLVELNLDQQLELTGALADLTEKMQQQLSAVLAEHTNILSPAEITTYLEIAAEEYFKEAIDMRLRPIASASAQAEPKEVTTEAGTTIDFNVQGITLKSNCSLAPLNKEFVNSNEQQYDDAQREQAAKEKQTAQQIEKDHKDSKPSSLLGKLKELLASWGRALKQAMAPKEKEQQEEHQSPRPNR